MQRTDPRPLSFAMKAAVVFAAFFAPIGGCDCSTSLEGGTSCESEVDCDGTAVCFEGRCVPPSEASDGGVVLDGAMANGDAAACREISSESSVQSALVDIIAIIDNSGSMTEEAIQTRDNINRFAEIIAESGLDYRVVLISRPEEDENGVCVPAPLGSGAPSCMSGPDGRLLAVHEEVESRNAPELIVDLYPRYRDFLREDAVKVFMWITDDQAARGYSADSIRERLADLGPSGMFDRQIHNAIVGYYGDTPSTWASESAGECESLARVGSVYMRLAGCFDNDDALIEGCTPGLTARVCEENWSTIFEDIARGVVEGVPVACEFAIPAPPTNLVIDFGEVAVSFTSDDGTTDLVRTTASACSDRGWHFDDEATPTNIVLCPELCRAVQSTPGASVDIGLGCLAPLQ